MCKIEHKEKKITITQDNRTKKSDSSVGGGHLSIVGIGPGNEGDLTARARNAITTCDVIVGYKTYTDLISDLTVDKEVLSSGMTRETDRCTKAVELLEAGKKVTLISSGDAGIYGMAGLTFEVIKKNFDLSLQSAVEVIPGVSSVQASAAILGAPLMHDFAVISLSDILTPWEVIERRLHAAAEGDFVIALLNPKSKKRTFQIVQAQKIILKHRKGETPVGIVKDAGRREEKSVVTDLENMLRHEIGMTTTLIIGNSETYVSGDKIVTPRIMV